MAARRFRHRKSPLKAPEQTQSRCFEITDSSFHRISAFSLIGRAGSRDPTPQAARIAQQFLAQNRGILSSFGITADLDYDGTSLDLVLQAGTRIGALPLLSPTTGKPDYGLVIKPRFDWRGIGPMLAAMGWRVVPTPLRLPLLPTSERKIPAWVLSTIILVRLKALLDRLDRRFEMVSTNLSAPKGSVDWGRYAISGIGRAKFLEVPCSFPDLRDDSHLKSAIHFSLLKQHSSLEGQRSAGIVVMHLIALCQSLIERVRNFTPRQPVPSFMERIYSRPLMTNIFREGIQAIEWTVEDRGLAGISDLEGIPWTMSMEEFFEAWLETLVGRLARLVGGIMRIGRKRETVTPLYWDPPYVGSQRYLLPDVVLEKDDATVIFDAKYKEHWEELNLTRWGNLDDEIRERHRLDLLQVLAYSTVHSKKRVMSCLVYPCRSSTWKSLSERERLYHKASLAAGDRKVDLILTAVPIDGRIDETAAMLSTAIANA